MKNRWVAFFLSLFIPGLGQLYLNEKPKAIAMLCITAGLAWALLANRSLITFLLIGPICPLVMIPAAVDAYQTASGKPKTFKGDSVFFVIAMLLVVGPFAIPLLWQSSKFSRTAKIIWTVSVVLIALGIIALLGTTASLMDAYYKKLSMTVSF